MILLKSVQDTSIPKQLEQGNWNFERLFPLTIKDIPHPNWVNLSIRGGKDRVFQGLAGLLKGNTEKQPCQREEHLVLPDLFTEINFLFAIGFSTLQNGSIYSFCKANEANFWCKIGNSDSSFLLSLVCEVCVVVIICSVVGPQKNVVKQFFNIVTSLGGSPTSNQSKLCEQFNGQFNVENFKRSYLLNGYSFWPNFKTESWAIVSAISWTSLNINAW